MKTIAVYGSLKRGFWNYNRFLTHANFLGVCEVSGVMQTPNSYPYLFEAGSIEDGINDTEYDIEVYEVEDEIFSMIKDMELGAMYYESSMDTPFGKATLFYTETELYNIEAEQSKDYLLENV